MEQLLAKGLSELPSEITHSEQVQDLRRRMNALGPLAVRRRIRLKFLEHKVIFYFFYFSYNFKYYLNLQK